MGKAAHALLMFTLLNFTFPAFLLRPALRSVQVCLVKVFAKQTTIMTKSSLQRVSCCSKHMCAPRYAGYTSYKVFVSPRSVHWHVLNILCPRRKHMLHVKPLHLKRGQSKYLWTPDLAIPKHRAKIANSSKQTYQELRSTRWAIMCNFGRIWKP